MSWVKITNMFSLMLEGSWQCIQIFVLTALFSVPLGILVALGRGCKIKPVSFLVRIYQLIMRGTPLMLQLLFVYFGPTFILKSFGIQFSMDRFVACILAFAINYAAYFGEIFRSGIAAIPRGQYEAGKVLGYTKVQTFFRIVLPQVIKHVIPPVGSEFMVLVKDTALASVIAQPQLFDVAKKSASTNASVIPYVAAALLFLAMSLVVEVAFNRIEKKLDYYH